METAWVEAERELEKLYGRNAVITRAFAGMNRQVQMNEPIEKCLMRFAMESGIEDLYHFAELFRYAKRNGGNMAEIIRSTRNRFREKEAVLEEIRTAVTAKQLEQRMMLILVPGILLFTTISSPEYGEVLYHTPLGILVMTACLAGYLAAALWGDRIVSIEV
jgi:tight adherence protein B